MNPHTQQEEGNERPNLQHITKQNEKGKEDEDNSMTDKVINGGIEITGGLRYTSPTDESQKKNN